MSDFPCKHLWILCLVEPDLGHNVTCCHLGFTATYLTWVDAACLSVSVNTQWYNVARVQARVNIAYRWGKKDSSLNGLIVQQTIQSIPQINCLNGMTFCKCVLSKISNFSPYSWATLVNNYIVYMMHAFISVFLKPRQKFSPLK